MNLENQKQPRLEKTWLDRIERNQTSQKAETQQKKTSSKAIVLLSSSSSSDTPCFSLLKTPHRGANQNLFCSIPGLLNFHWPIGPSARRKFRVTLEVAAALERTRTLNQNAVYVLTSAAEAQGGAAANVAINQFIIWHSRCVIGAQRRSPSRIN